MVPVTSERGFDLLFWFADKEMDVSRTYFYIPAFHVNSGLIYLGHFQTVKSK